MAIMSVAAYLVMNGYTPQEIKSSTVQIITKSSISSPALVVSSESKSDNIILFANKKYSLTTIKDLENWITEHWDKDLRVAYGSGEPFLCLKDDHVDYTVASSRQYPKTKLYDSLFSISPTYGSAFYDAFEGDADLYGDWLMD